jgi:hypothetical protein
MNEKRYWLLTGYYYEASGGMNDLQGKFDSAQDAIDSMAGDNPAIYCDWWHILDIKSGEVVNSGTVQGGKVDIDNIDAKRIKL